MSRQEELFFAKIAISMKLLTPAQLASCLQIQKAFMVQKKQDVSLLQLMVGQKILSPMQISFIQKKIAGLRLQVTEQTMESHEQSSSLLEGSLSDVNPQRSLQEHTIAESENSFLGANQTISEEQNQTICEEDQKSMGKMAQIYQFQTIASPESEIEQCPSTQNFIPAKSQASDQKQFGRYVIMDTLGQGGMGKVYKVFDPVLKRNVALKILLSTSDNSTGVERFLREAQATANLRHPNIVAVYDIGIENEQHYFTMDYIPGKSLKDLIKKNPLPARQASKIMMKVGDAIHYAHRQGIIHRDLKPGNVMMSEEKEPKVMDFGLAKLSEASKKLSRTGMILGTLQYMPPEQAQGLMAQIDARSDVYSLGAMLYQLITGKPPFVANTTFAIINKILNYAPTPPTQVNPNLPKDIDRICLKALEKEKEMRYQTAAAFADDLARFVRGDTVLAIPPGFFYKCNFWIRKNPLLASLVGVILFILAFGSIFIHLRIQSEKVKRAQEKVEIEKKAKNVEMEAKDEAIREKINALKAKQEAENAKQEARRNLVKIYIEHADAFALKGEQQKACLYYALASRIAKESEAPEDMQREIRSKLMYQFPKLSTFKVSNFQYRLPKPPSGFANEDFLIDMFLQKEDVFAVFHWFLREKYKEEFKSSFLANWKTSKPIFLDSFIGAAGYNSKRNLFISAYRDGNISLWDLKTGKWIKDISTSLGKPRFILPLKDIEYLNQREVTEKIRKKIRKGIKAQDVWLITVMVAKTDQEWIVRGRTRSLVEGDFRCVIVKNLSKHRLEGYYWSRKPVMTMSADFVATSSESGKIYIWNLRKEKLETTFTNDNNWDRKVTCLAFTPDEKYLAVGSLEKVVLWEIATGKTVRSYLGHSAKVSGLCFSHSGEILATASHDNTIRTWNVKSGATKSILKGHTGVTGSDGEILKDKKALTLTFSPNDKLLLTGGTDQSICIWSAENGELLQNLRVPFRSIQKLVFHPQGTKLFVLAEDKNKENVLAICTLGLGQAKVIRKKQKKVKRLSFVGNEKLVVGYHSSAWLYKLNAQKKSKQLYIPTSFNSSNVRKKNIFATLRVSELRDISVSKNQEYIAIAVDDKVCLYDKDGGFIKGRKKKESFFKSKNRDAVYAVAIDAKGKRFVCSDRNRMSFCRIKNKRLKKIYQKKSRVKDRGIAFSPSGKFFAYTTQDNIYICSFQKNRPKTIKTLKNVFEIKSIAFQPMRKNGELLLVTGNQDGSIAIWNIMQENPEFSFLKGHTSNVLSLSFSPDGKILASGGEDKTVRLWDMETKKNCAIYKDHASSVNSVSFSPDGKKLACGENNGSIHIRTIRRDTDFLKAKVEEIKRKVEKAANHELRDGVMIPLQRK